MDSTAAPKKEIYVFDKRDESESSRLNFQHNLALKVSNGHLIHPLIPISNLRSIADIGTGTGIWLEELQEQVSSDARLDGFDISAAQFPPESKCNYSVQNLLEPFDVKYHGFYDLVHIRYMVVAFKREQYLTGIKNMFQILKPGGYLQWDDFDYAQICTRGPPAPTFNELHSLTKNFFSGLGMSLNCSLEVLDGMKQAGMVDVSREQRNSYWDKSLDSDAHRWTWMSYSGCVEKALMRSGEAKDEETAARIMNEKMKTLDQEYQSGAVPNFAQRIVIGRKPM